MSRNIFSIFVLLTLFVLCLQVYSQSSKSESPELQLNTVVVNEQYCSKSKLLLQLNLNFTNTGSIPIFLDKNSKVVTTYIIKKIVKNQCDEPLEWKVSPFINLNKVLKLEEPPVQNNFILLKQNESYNIEISRPIWLDDESDDPEGELTPGEYSLQIKVGTWFYSPSIIDKYKKDWQEQGFLWTSDIISDPMNFRVKNLNKRQIVSCN